MLDISPILLLSSAIIFLVVLWQLNKNLYQPLFKHIEDRNKSIKDDLESIQNNSDEIDSLIKEGQNIIAKAKQEASSIRENAYNEAKAVVESKMIDFKKELDLKYSFFLKDLLIQKESAKDSLVNDMSRFKEKISAKISSL